MSKGVSAASLIIYWRTLTGQTRIAPCSGPPHRMSNDDRTFWADVDQHLIRYGTPFSPRIIVRASGSYVYDVEDNKILDFTSGQVHPLLATVWIAPLMAFA